MRGRRLGRCGSGILKVAGSRPRRAGVRAFPVGDGRRKVAGAALEPVAFEQALGALGRPGAGLVQ